MSSTANGGLDRKRLINSLVIELLVINGFALDVSNVSDSLLRTNMTDRRVKAN